jgi:hypothetical protein
MRIYLVNLEKVNQTDNILLSLFDLLATDLSITWGAHAPYNTIYSYTQNY